MVRVVLAEDQFLLRDGLVRLWSSHGIDVVAAVAHGADILPAVTQYRPDLVLLDIRLPPTFRDEGLRAALDARSRTPGLPVVLLSQYVEQLYVQELLEDGKGGVGYLLKDRVFDDVEFVGALRTVQQGGTVIDPDAIAALIGRERVDNRLDRLTGREREVLGLMAHSDANAAIASKLVITEKAVAKHINNILAKLDLPPSTTTSRRVAAVLTYLQS